jgi:hypothetical protein
MWKLAFQIGHFTLGTPQCPPPAGTPVDPTFHPVVFNAPFPEQSRVVVTPMVQTYNGSDSPGLRIKDVTRTGFTARLCELRARSVPISDEIHCQESIGYIAVALYPAGPLDQQIVAHGLVDAHAMGDLSLPGKPS